MCKCKYIYKYNVYHDALRYYYRDILKETLRLLFDLYC